MDTRKGRRLALVIVMVGALTVGAVTTARAACIGLGSATSACGPERGGAGREETFGAGAGGDEAPPRISIRNDSTPEGTTEIEGESENKLRFKVVLDHASSETVKVKFATSPGTASPSDYNDKTGTVTFQPGQTQKVVGVAVIGDFIGEPEEQMSIALSKPNNGKMADGDATGTIVDDDNFTP